MCRPAIRIAPKCSCNDPLLSPDLHWLTTGLVSPLCYHGGSVIPANETYALAWDPDRRYWATTRQYLEQFLSDVGPTSDNLGSPYAVTPQYTMAGGTVRAQDKSLFAGGCIDYGNSPGNPSGYTCQFGANHPQHRRERLSRERMHGVGSERVGRRAERSNCHRT